VNSLETLSRKTGVEGQQADLAGLEPFVVKADAIAGYPPFPFPVLGTHRPPGWRMCNTLFCDSSGFGLETEPALTPSQLQARLKPGYGYAVVEQGQFQLVLGEFVPPDHQVINSKLVKIA
jgi:hypothetical protein